MNTFLKYTAEKIIAECGDNLGNTIIVFPNQRPIVFLKEEIKQLVNKTIFMPQMMSIDNFVGQLSKLEIVSSNAFIFFDLYKIHLEMKNDKYQRFEEFMPFADMLINDFSEVDSYLVNAEDLFSNIYDLKEIGEWDISGENTLAGKQSDYLKFYKSLYSYYTRFRDTLAKQGKAYYGMAYRKVAENFDEYIPQFEGKKIYFVGFNALNECERKIIRPLINNGMATMITDGDDYYFKNETQEAGKFLRLLLNDGFCETESYGTYFGKEKKKITIVDCPENIVQAKVAGELLSKLNNFDSTAVVLADETMLIPVLNSLPENIDAANVTMEFPYTYTILHNLVSDIFALHTNKKNDSYYFKDIINVVSNVFIQHIIDNPESIKNIRNSISKENNLYVSYTGIAKANKDLEKIKFLFSDEAANVKVFLDTLEQLVKSISQLEILKADMYVKERVSLIAFADIIRELKRIANEMAIDGKELLLSDMQRIYTKMLKLCRISFKGEPLRNLQILGMLETRSLDFENIILLSANESRLPQGKSSKSLIPLQLKVHAGMRTYRENDSIFAYYFYRLLQRCKNIWLVYNSDSNGDGKGEASRFLFQIQKELAEKYRETIEIENKVVSVKNNNNTDIPIDPEAGIPKSEVVMQRLKDIASHKKGFSPSALSVYIKCPIKYYFEKVLGINEEKDPTEDIDASELGTVVHNILEAVFDPKHNQEYEKGYLKLSVLKRHLESIDSKIEAAINAVNPGMSETGKGFLFRNLVKEQTTHFISKQIKQVEALQKEGKGIMIKGVEEEYVLPILDNIHITGKIDRIDFVGEQLRIIDYKTGIVAKDDISRSTSKGRENEKEKWFQLMTYAWLYWKKSNKSIVDFKAGIYPLGNTSSDLLELKNGTETILTEEILSEFEESLANIVGEIMNPDEPFKAKPNNDTCRYCRFKQCCNAQK